MMDGVQTGSAAAAVVPEDERGHFIPIRKTDILDALIEHGDLAGENEREQFRQVCKLLASIYHFEYFERLEKLRDAYFYFSPELDLQTRFDRTTLDRAYHDLIEQFSTVLKGANFVEMTREEVEAAHTKREGSRIAVEAPVEDFRDVKFFRRGHHQETFELSRWFGLRKRSVEAMVHDDIEHVLGYSILQDAAVAVLAFASLDPAVVAAARNWLVASATVKTALAAWASVVRNTYGGHRLDDLGGWARHSPALGVAFAGILVAAIGLPNMALFQARTDLVEGALPGIGAAIALVIAVMPAIYLGRIAIAGLAPVSPAVAAGPTGRPRWRGGRAAGWSGGPLVQAIRAIPGELRANRAPLMALGVLALSVMALLTATGGAGG